MLGKALHEHEAVGAVVGEALGEALGDRERVGAELGDWEGAVDGEELFVPFMLHDAPEMSE